MFENYTMTSATEKAAIAATLTTTDLLARIRTVAGREIGDPLNIPNDCVSLREQFGITIETNFTSVFAFNDAGVCASIPIGETFGLQHQGRRVACVAIASMWTPDMEIK